MLIPHSLSRKLWIPFLACVLLIPTISWSMNAPFAVGLQSSFSMLTLIGQITGIIGSQLFATALLLSARLKSVEYLFGGLDKMYVIHHRIGTIAFSFLAIHPLVLAFRYLADSVEDVMWFLIPLHKETPWYEIMPKDFGIYALWSMFVLLFVTFYGATFKYPSLKTAHRFMGAAFFLAGLHMFYIPSSMSSDIVLKIACLGMASLGIIAYTYRTLLGRFLVPRYKYTVSKVFDVGQGVTEITLLPSKKALTHIPGQFAMLSFFGAKVVSDEEHPFTISGGPRGGGVTVFN